MKKLLLIAFYVILPAIAMEIDEPSITEKQWLSEIEYIENYKQELSPQEADNENKQIIKLFDIFANKFHAMDSDMRTYWHNVIDMFTTNIFLSSEACQENVKEVAKIFIVMDKSKRKRWQFIISQSFNQMQKDATRKENFSYYVQQYLKSDYIIHAIIDGYDKEQSSKRKFQHKELIDELRRLYPEDELFKDEVSTKEEGKKCA